MTVRTALFLLLPIVASIALVQRRRVAALIGMGLFSLVLSAAYAIENAPDVALTEATIGAALVTTVYVLAIRRTGRLIVVADEAPHLLERKGARLAGLEYEILAGFARELGLDLSIRFVPRQEVETGLLSGEADIAAGGIVHEADPRFYTTRGYLETGLVRIGREGAPTGKGSYEGYFSDLIDAVREGKDVGATLDLARFMAVMRGDLTGVAVERIPGKREYVFLVSKRREEIHTKLAAYLDEIEARGELAEIIERNLR